MAWKAHRDSDGQKEAVEFRWKVQIQSGPNLFKVEPEGQKDVSEMGQWSDGEDQRRASGQIDSETGQKVRWKSQMVRKRRVGRFRWSDGSKSDQLKSRKASL